MAADDGSGGGRLVGRQVRLLADTQALVWAVSNPELLGSAALAAFENDEIVASVACLWELSLKSGKKNALVADPVPWWQKICD